MRDCIVRIPVYLREASRPCTWASGTVGTWAFQAVSACSFSFFFRFYKAGYTICGVLCKVKCRSLCSKSRKKIFLIYIAFLKKNKFHKHLIISSVPDFVLGSRGVGVGAGGYHREGTWAVSYVSCSSRSTEGLEGGVIQFQVTDRSDEDISRPCYLQHWELPILLCFKPSRSTLI